MTVFSAFLAAGWGMAAGLAIALLVALWVLSAVLALLRRGGNPPELPSTSVQVVEGEVSRAPFRQR